MIRYDITEAELHRRIDELDPRWRASTAERTERFRQARRYDENSGAWGRVKAVYMGIQHNKCAYCERRLEGGAPGNADFGRIEHDLEHYRPKSSVRRWAAPDQLSGYRLGGKSAKGYYLLAYHPRNYLASCKTCNSTLKSNCFPIAGRRNTRGSDPVRLASEKPLLPYPLGDVDDDPETIIAFEGVSPVAVADRGHRRHRAEVTVAFFKLDVREELLRGRARVVLDMAIALRFSESTNPTDRGLAELSVKNLMDKRSPHAACARSFRRLYRSGPDRAMDLAQGAIAYLNSES